MKSWYAIRMYKGYGYKINTKRRFIMKTKKTLATLGTTLAVILMTGGFALAESLAVQNVNAFPYFQLGCLMVGGMILVSLKNKYEKIFTAEAVGVFALYTILISLFTSPVIEAVKNLVS